MEAYLREHLHGMYFDDIASISATHGKVTVRMKSSDPEFPYSYVCDAARFYALERSVVRVEVLDAKRTVKSASDGVSECDKR